MKKHLAWLGVFGVLALGGCVTRQARESTNQPEPSHGAPQAEATTPQPGLLRVTLALGDGSKVIGEPVLAVLPLRMDYTKMEIPFTKISSLKFTAGTTNAVVTLANGDKLSAVPGITELRLTTLFGKVTIQLKLMTSLTVSAGGVSAVPRDGLILWFPFDGVQGPEVTDASEQGHAGKLFAGARIVADEGRRRDVLELDGRGAHIRVPGSPDFALTNLTFLCWVKLQDWNKENYFLSTLSPNAADGGYQFYIEGASRLAFGGRPPHGAVPMAVRVKLENAERDTWHFIAVTFAYNDGSYQTRTFFDGKLIRGSETQSALINYVGQELHIGTNCDSAAAGLGAHSQREFEGRMDDLMLFTRALSAEEIAALYNAQK
jgi:hypothetical protein